MKRTSYPGWPRENKFLGDCCNFHGTQLFLHLFTSTLQLDWHSAKPEGVSLRGDKRVFCRITWTPPFLGLFKQAPLPPKPLTQVLV